MNKRLFAAAFALLLLTVFSPDVFALSYTDDCENIQASDIATYSGFSKVAPASGLGWAGCDDLFSLKVKNDYAAATYKVGGAESIRVEILTDMPAYVANDPGEGYVLGKYPVTTLANAVRCRYDRAFDAIFISDEAHDYIVQSENGNPLLVSEARQCDLKSEFFGLNVAVSSGGFEYTKCDDVKLIEVYMPKSRAYYKETYLVKVPPGVVGVKLKLNFFSMIYGTDGMDIYGSEKNMLLARVVFSGSRLYMGDAPPPSSSEPEASESEPDESSSEPSEPESSKPESSKPESSRPESSKPESSRPESSKPESSKPESSKPESSKPESSNPNPVPPPVLPEIPADPPVNRPSAYGGGETETDESEKSKLKPRGGGEQERDAENGQAGTVSGQGTARDRYVQDENSESAYGRTDGSVASRTDAAKAGEKNRSGENAQSDGDVLLGGGSISAVAVLYIGLSLLLRRRG